MPDFTGGYTSAVDAQSHRAYEGANTQWLLDALTAAKHKRDLEEQQRQQLIRDQIVQGQAYSQMAPPPQSPPPGAASQPMQGPQAPPMMPPGGPPMGPGGPPPGPPNIAAHFPPGTTTGTAPNPQAALAIMKAMDASGQKGAIGVQPPAPAGWQPSPGASPALGGPGAPPAAAPSTGQIAPPPMGGAGPEASQPGVIPGQMLSVPKAIETLKGMNIPPDQIVRVLDKMMPAINAQNKQAADAFKLETNAQKAAIEAYKAYILGTQRAETQAKDVASKVERRASGAAQKQEEIDLKRQQASGVAGRGSGGVSSIPEADQAKTGSEFLATLPTGIAKEVKAIAEGRQNISAMGYRGAQRQQMLERVNQYDPTFDQTQFAARSATRRDFASGQAARNVTSINTAIGHLGTMDELATAMHNGDVRKLNAVVNRVATETGNPDINNFQLAATAVSDEMMRTFRQVGASDAEAARWEKAFKSDLASGQLKGSMQIAVKLLESRAQALGDQWASTMGDTISPPEIIHSRSRDVLKQLGVKMTDVQHGRGASSAAAAVPTATNPKTGEKVEYRDGKWQLVKP